MKNKNLVDIIVATLFIILGLITIILPTFNITNIKLILAIIFSGYTLFNLGQFYLTRKSKDTEGLFTGIISLLILVGILFIDYKENYFNLALIMFIWIAAVSFVKLNKCDYYHDRKNKMWIYKVIALGIFVVVGIVTCFNLYTDNKLLILGYYFLINGILELIDPLLLTILEKKKI